MIVAKIKVGGVCAVAEYRKLIPAGIIGAQVLFDYADDVWKGLRKTVVFRGAVTKDVITDDEVVTIPAEVVAKPNVALCLGVYGVDAYGNLAIPTLWADLGTVRSAADPEMDITADPSLPVWAQLHAMIGNLDDLDTTAKNNLVAAVNEALTKGGGSVDEAEIQRIVDDYLAENPPTVTETDPTVPAWAKQPQKPTYTADEVHALPDTYIPPNQTAQQVGADPAGTAASAVSQHNTDTAAHNDLRLAMQELANRVNAALDSDDTTLDQLSEIVTYIKSNKTLIDAITTSKVSITDIVNDLVTNVADKPLSAAQGVVLKGLIEELRTLIPEAYTLPTATETTLGGVKPVTATDAMTQSVGVTTDGRLVTKPGDGGGEEVWEDICDITFAEDVLSARILTSDMGIHYKKIEASGQGFSAKHVACFSNASRSGEHANTYDTIQNWVVSSIRWFMMGFTRFSLYPVADKAFESMCIGSGISAQQNDSSPEYAPCAWAIAGNHPAAICFVSNYSAGGIDQISIYSNDNTTVIPAGARLQIRGVRA